MSLAPSPFSKIVAPTCVLLAGTLGAQTPDVIYTEIASSPTSIVPGTLDGSALPTVARWLDIRDLVVSPDGGSWTLNGRIDLGPGAESALVLGSGTMGSMLAQEGQRFLGGVTGDVYGSFYPHAVTSFDTTGGLAFRAIALNGTSVTDRLVVHDTSFGSHTVVVQQGDLVTGASDFGTSGDETIGVGFGSIGLLDSGEVSYVNAMRNVLPGLDRAYLRGQTVWRQQSVSQVVTLLFGATTFKSIFPTGNGTTPDGLHWFIQGEASDEPLQSDQFLLVDGRVVLQESLPIAGSSTVFASVIETHMVSNGDWIARGLDPNGGLWVVYNEELLLRSGDPVDSDQVGVSAIGFGAACNRVGDWAVSCSTTEASTTNDVVVLNNEIVLREGDPVDVDGDGLFDDDAFLGEASPSFSTFLDLWLTDDLALYFVARLRDGSGGDLGKAVMRLQLPSLDFCEGSDGAMAFCPCASGRLDTGCDLPQASGGVRLSVVEQQAAVQNRATLSGTGYSTMGAPTSVVIRSSSLDPLTPVVFGDGLRCVSNPFVRLSADVAVGGVSTHVIPHEASLGSGDFYYQLLFRSGPASYCDPTAAFNLSSGRVLTW